MKTKAKTSLSRRIFLAFMLFSLLCSLLFAVINLLFVYTAEDNFFYRQLQLEINRQQQLKKPEKPPYDYLALYQTPAQFPADLAAKFEPAAFLAGASRAEYSGADGRHYHLQKFVHASTKDPMYLVAEVSQQLVIRPIRDRMLLLYAVVSLVFLLMSLGLGWYLARRASAPLATLATVLSSEPLPAFFASRFADKEIYALAYQLEQSLSRLQQFAERERHFSRDASHELRTPLAVIQTSAELLMLEAAKSGIEGAAARRLQQIQQASSQMQQLIETLLLLSREGKGEVPEAVPLKAMLQQLWLAQQQWQSRTDLQLELDVADEAMFFAPALLLRLLLNNLLQNAFCHSGAGPLQLQFAHNQLLFTNPLAAPGQPRQGLRGFGTGIAERLASQSGLKLSQYQQGDYWVCCLVPLDDAGVLQGN